MRSQGPAARHRATAVPPQRPRTVLDGLLTDQVASDIRRLAAINSFFADEARDARRARLGRIAPPGIQGPTVGCPTRSSPRARAASSASWPSTSIRDATAARRAPATPTWR